MTTARALNILLVALAVVGVLFAKAPGLDLALTGLVYDHGGFWGGNAAARAARDILRLAPFWLLGALVAATLARRFLAPWLPAPSCGALLFLAASLTLGSGLIVNLGLKDHSHRPRPVHVEQFGGDKAFRPWNRFDGECVKNCAFASGEAASSAWTLAPALLVPPPWRAAAFAAAATFYVATSALRVAFGGHFVSDVLIGGLISALCVVAMWRLWGRREL